MPDWTFFKGSPFILLGLGSDLWCPRVIISKTNPLARLCGAGIHPVEQVCLRLCHVKVKSSSLNDAKEDYLRWFKLIQIAPRLPDRVTLRDPLLYPNEAPAEAEACRRRVWALITLVGLVVALPKPVFLVSLEVNYPTSTLFLWVRYPYAGSKTFKIRLPRDLSTMDKLFDDWVQNTRVVSDGRYKV